MKLRVLIALPLLAACGDAGAGRNGGWAGTIDTLANGVVLVSNPIDGLWAEGAEWRIEEDLRIGSATVEGPELFGSIGALEVDELGRIYVAESQAQEVRVFNADGTYLRTIGQDGGGPGEFAQISGIGWGPDGNLWVMDTRNNRMSVFDTTGAYITSHRRPGGFMILPWPGGFDDHGRVYDMVGVPRDGDFALAMVRYDAQMTPMDTFYMPPEEDGDFFELVGEGGSSRMRAGVPFSPGPVSRFDPEGYVWMGITDQYRLHRVSFDGDTVRTVAREFEPVSVSAAEHDEALESLDWFTEQGGKIDPSRIPDTKPAFIRPLFDDTGHMWVTATTAEGVNTTWDIFDPEGRYLGAVVSPVDLAFRSPVFKGDELYAVVTDEMDVPYVIRARIVGRD
jgi:sugar lactone lactonase YvrE